MSALTSLKLAIWSLVALTTFATTGCSSEEDDTVGAGQAVSEEDASAGPTAVESRTSDIPTYNSQVNALTAADMCQLFASGDVDVGEATVTCSKVADGVVKLTASKDELSASVLANATDKYVLEYQGFDELHEYRNNLGETALIKFVFVTSGTHRTVDGTQVDGSFRGDLVIGNGDQRYRFGYYFNQKL